LLQAIEAVDVPESDKNNMLGKTYELMWNKALAFSHHPETYHMFLPYGTWEHYDEINPSGKPPVNKPVQSLLASGFKDAVAEEYVKPFPSSGNFFIDIACLGDLSSELMTQDNNGGESVASAIAKPANGITNTAVTPIIRILVGKDALDTKEKTEGDINNAFHEIFWNKNGPLIRNTRAILYVGRYAPDFRPYVPLMKEKQPEVTGSIQAY
jgi:hypothetical protein